MKVTVLGGCGAWPTAGQACSGYLVEQDGFRLLLDPGYAVLPRLLTHIDASEVDAVLVSHGHPDHCADLNPLLRARVLGDRPTAALPVYAPPGSLDAVLALDRVGMLAEGYELRSLAGPGLVHLGPFRVESLPLPHFVPNLGFRLSCGGATLAYTGDTGPSPDIARLASGVEVFLAEATYIDRVPAADAACLSTARQAAGYATAATVGRLVLTHLWPGTDAAAAVDAAGRVYSGPVEVATPGLAIELP